MSNRAAAQVKFLVKSKGRAAVLTLSSTGTYDVATSSYTKGTPEVHNVKAYTSSFKSSDVDGTSVIRGDQKVLIPATDILEQSISEPKVGDTIEVNSNEYRIEDTQTIYEGESVAAYICQARR